jgi:hypothetical protein
MDVPSSPQLWNTIVASNTAAVNPDVSGVVTSLGHNLIGATDGSSLWLASDLKGTVLAPTNALLGPLQDNGGPTPTMALLPGSPAIDAGGSGLATDQRGLPRYVHIGTSVPPGGDWSDIGAFELQAASIGIDIGLRVYDGTATNHIAAEAPEPGGQLTSPIRITKNGTNYGILLTATNAPNASRIRIQTSAGTKAWMKLP